MKELVIISGKGGTGKTSIAACLAVLAKNAVLVDCDVDAADLHLILKPDIKERSEFISGETATIDKNICVACGECERDCRFDAITQKDTAYIVDPLSCEGCKVCQIVCPVNAVTMNENICGSWFLSETRCGKMLHAELKPGSENSGKLVSLVRQKAKETAASGNADLIIIDGPPGIGCPVIASVGGTNLAIIVTEPTQSGVHDLKRVAQLTRHFKIPTCVCINKYDINTDIVTDIETYCSNNGFKVVGKIPYDLDATKALINELSIVEFLDTDISKKITGMWNNLKLMLNKEGVKL